MRLRLCFQPVRERDPDSYSTLLVEVGLNDVQTRITILLGARAKCLILDSGTPSVMVALRGGEASIRQYYRSSTGVDAGKKTWRQITQELKKDASKHGISDTFISFLDYLGDAKRNFAQHPNKTYSVREAAVIFMQIVAMVEDIYAQI